MRICKSSTSLISLFLRGLFSSPLHIGLIILSSPTVLAQTTSNQYAVNQQIAAGSFGLYYVDITGAPANATITNVEAKFDYIAYGVVQNYVSVRFNRASDPGPSGGAVMVSQGSLPAGNPGTYGYVSFSSWNGQLANARYYFRYAVASGSPFTSTLNTIYVRVTYTTPALNPPTLVSPINGTSVSGPPFTFTWQSVSGACQYQIKLSTDPAFTTTIFNDPNVSGSATSYPYNSSLAAGVTHYWQMRTLNATCATWGAWSASQTFVPQAQTLPAPTLISPINGTSVSGPPFTFTWQSVSGACQYQIKLSTDPTFTTTIFNDPNVSGSATSYPYNSSLAAGVTHYWQMRTLNATCATWGAWSASQTFVPQAQTLPAPTLLSPINGASVSGPPFIFTWQSVNGACQYQIKLSTDPTFTTTIFNDPNVSGSATSYPYNSSLAASVTHYWQMRTLNATCATWGAWSASQTFVPQAPTPVPTLTYPPNGGGVGFDLTPDLAWTHPGATRFWGQIDNNSNFSSPEGENTNIQTLGWTPTLTTYAVYYWRIKALGTNGVWSDWSSTWSFTVGALAPTLQLPTPNQSITTNEINFQWTNVYALRYELYVDNNAGFGSPEVSPLSIPAFNDFHNVVYTLTGNWLNQNVYYWKVRAYFQSGPFMESSVGTFTYQPPKDLQPSWVPVYRAYYSTDVDHFYCTNSTHLAQAENGGYVFEKVEGFLGINPFEAGADMRPVYRFYTGQDMSHYYTADETDRDNKIINGWIYEGITGYGYASTRPGLVKMFYLYLDNSSNNALRDHFYTISQIERDNALARGYQDRGFLCYVSANGDSATESWMEAQMMAGDGVNTQNGNFNHYVKTSFSIPGTRMSLDFAHMYNSYSTRLFSLINPLGSGWSHTYHSYVVESSDQQYAFVVWPDGAVHEYKLISGNYVCQTPGVYDIFTKAASTFTVKKKDQMVFTFVRPSGTSADYPAMLSSITDRNGNTVACTYEPSGLRRLISVSHGSRTLTFTYHTGARSRLLWKVQDPLPRTIEFNYDDVDTNLTSSKDAMGQTTTYAYEPSARQDHLLKSITFPKGNSITNQYQNRKLVSQTGGPISLSLGYSGAQTTVTEGGIQYNHFYNNNQRSGLIDRVVNSSNTVRYEYTDVNNPTKPTRLTDGKGYVTTIVYDSRGNETMITRPLSIIHGFQYDAMNNLTKYINPLSKETNYAYNASGNLISVQDPRGTTSITPLSNGLIDFTLDPLAQRTTLGYNSYGNLTSVRDNLNHTTGFGYDGVSRMTSTTNAKGQATSYAYNNNDLRTTETNALGQSTSYSYDLNGNLTSIGSPGGTYSFTYYAANDLLQTKTHPGQSATQYAYDTGGRVVSRADPNGQTTTYGYDNVGRLLLISSLSVTATFGYDNNNNITSVTGGANNLLFTYDQLNRMSTTSDFFGNTVSYTYDAAGNILTITYPGSRTVTYTYYDDDRLKTVQAWTGGTFTYFYRNDGTLDYILYPNGGRAIYAYDAASRVIGIVHTKPSGQVICSYSFTLDEIGNHTAVTQTEPLAMPNLTPGTTSYTYDGGNRILSTGSTTFTFDGNGNMATRSGTNSATYSYDSERRLTSITGSNTASYLYDIFGDRRSATRNGATTRYVLDVNGPMSQILMEQDASGNPSNYYIYGLGLLARIKPDGTIHYYHGDFRGSTIAMTDVSGNITHKYSYGPFGELRASVELDFNLFRYVGVYGVMDEGNGLYFMRARYYDPILGRFTSEDPVWQINLYTYAENNPTMLSDPEGTESRALWIFNKTLDFLAHGFTRFAKGIAQDIALKLSSKVLRKHGYDESAKSIDAVSILTTPFVSGKEASDANDQLLKVSHKLRDKLIRAITSTSWYKERILLKP